MIASAKVNLLNFDRHGLEAFFANQGEKAYRATQMIKWIHQRGVIDFDKMTDLSKVLRTRLVEITEFSLPTVKYRQHSKDGTRKWILELADGNAIETVFIPEDDRGTLCVSSQVGCALNCSFCSTGRQGFSRNLTTAEIISQLWIAKEELSKEAGNQERHVSNVVFMGMGEPLLNFDQVVPAMELMMDDMGYGLSKRRVTLSTSGLVPAMKELKAVSDVALAVSLHAPNDALRDVLVPINKKYPLAELMAVCRDYYPKTSRRKITFEYVMLDGVNDQPKHAKQLCKILEGVPGKMNLIPFNPFERSGYERSPMKNILAFRDILQKAGIITTIRKTRGEDIDAACGQLVGEVQDRTRRKERLAKQLGQIAVKTEELR